MTASTSPAPPPAWFADPTGRHRYRWWNGSTWTRYIWDDERGTATDDLMPRWRWGLITAGGVVAGLALMVAVLFSMGDDDSVGRSGLRRGDGGLTVLSAVCPGERLRALELDAVDEAGRRTPIWRLSGDAALPDELVVGDVPAGLRTTRPLATPDPSSMLRLQLDTSRLTHVNILTVPADAFRGGHIVTAYASYDDPEVFRAAAFADLPCADPYGDRSQARAVITAVLLAASSGGVSALVFVTRRRLRPPTYA